MSAASLPPESYAGPLDLLLDEVRRQQIAIEDVALAPLVARYLDYIQRPVGAGKPLAIDWILLAATLIQWKSRVLLAPAAAAVVDLFRDELVEQLRAHRQQVASDLARRQAVQSGQFSRDADPVFGDDPVPAEPTFLSVWDLTEQARELARWATQHPQNQQRSRLFLANESTEVPVADMVAYLLAQFAQSGPELSASRLLFLQPDPAHQVSLFLALLEMAESQQLRIRQDEEFDEILLMRQSAG